MATNPMQPLLQSNELLALFTGRAVEAFSLWADANQKLLRELVDLSASTAKEGVRRFKLFEGTAQAMSRSAERLQVTAEHTGRETQATFTQLAGKVQSLYTPLT